MPQKISFKSSMNYYATLLHELVHWTGHESRLNRHFDADYSLYGFEELVAELGSAFLCANLGVTGKLQHASYIGGWLKLLKEDDKVIFKAAAHASKAYKYIMALTNKNADSHVEAVA